MDQDILATAALLLQLGKIKAQAMRLPGGQDHTIRERMGDTGENKTCI